LGKVELSVCVVNWNRAKDLEEALRSAEKQSISRDNYEVIVVDNNSSDGSCLMVQKNFPLVRLIPLPQNVGCAAGFNVAMRAAEGKYLVNLDSDSLLEEEALEKVIQEFEPDPQVGIVAFRVQNLNTLREENVKGRENSHYINAAVGLRKSLLEKVGYYSEELFIYGEEEDFCLRVFDSGYQIKYCPHIVAYHKESGIERGRNRFLYFNTRNVLWIFWKYYPLRPLAEAMAVHLLVNLSHSLYRGGLFIYLKAVADSLSQLKRIRRKRKPTPNWKKGKFYPSLGEFFLLWKKKWIG